VLPYRLRSRDELDRVVAGASAAAGDPGAVRALVADTRGGQQLGGAVAAAERHGGPGCRRGRRRGDRGWRAAVGDARGSAARGSRHRPGVLALARAAIPALLRQQPFGL
jgi:hypothetical protein